MGECFYTTFFYVALEDGNMLLRDCIYIYKNCFHIFEDEIKNARPRQKRSLITKTQQNYHPCLVTFYTGPLTVIIIEPTIMIKCPARMLPFFLVFEAPGKNDDRSLTIHPYDN